MSDATPKWADLFGIDPDWPVSDTERENHTLRRILTDLIADLRWEHRRHLCACGCNRQECVRCGDDWPCRESQGADRAEARLREVTDG